MYHFFVSEEQITDNEIIILGTDVNHIKNVLRMNEGEKLLVLNGMGKEFFSSIAKIYPDSIKLNILEERQVETELPIEITLFQVLPKLDKMDIIIRKAIELGAKRIVPVKMKRSIVKLDEKKAKKKQERWQMIAESAAKQSGRGVISEVAMPMTFKEAIREAEKLENILVPYECAHGMKETKEKMTDAIKGKSIGVFIGPEGGFEEDEIDELREADASTITLGKRILRTETAGMTILSVLMFMIEGKDE